MAAAAGAGAAAAAHLNAAGSSSSSSAAPKPPDGPSSGRPYPRKEPVTVDSAEDAIWRGLLQGIGGSEAAGECFQRCVTIAAQLQRESLELAASARLAGLGEVDLKRLVIASLFQPWPNPQDGPTVGVIAAPEPDSQQMMPEAREGCPDGHLAPAKLGKEALLRRKSLKINTGGGGVCVSKHMHGCPTVIYDMGANLGEGSFGTVRKARHKQTGQFHAVKSVPKSKINPDELWGEINIMKQLDHPHIMRLYYTFEDDTAIYMASEMCVGGELYDTIEEAGFLTERTCCLLFDQILKSVNYLHYNSIAHRDLKPENFLLLKRAEYHEIQLKLIDFGTAKRFDTLPLVTKVCTAHYVAPEVLKRGTVPYTEKVDIWSCGSILYMMLCGFMPFHHDDHLELLKLVKKGKYSFKPERVWKLISDEAKALIRNMMCLIVENRFNAIQCIHHEWIANSHDQIDHCSVDEQIVRQMRKFLTNNRLKRVALQIIARQIKDEAVERLRSVFLGIDEDCSGCLTHEEMTEALNKLDLSEASKQEMAQILVCVDQDQSGTIEWTEFLAATLTKEQYLTETACRGAFHLMDIDEDGVLNRADLASFLTGQMEGPEGLIGMSTMCEIEQIMRDTDENSDGDISFIEFMALMADEGPRASDTAVSIRYRRGKKEKHRVITDGAECEDDDEDDSDDEVSEHDAFGDDLPHDDKGKEHKDPHEGWLLQSQKAWELNGKNCTLTIYAKKDEGLLEFEVHFVESGENLTGTGSKEEFEKLCAEKEQTGLSSPAATLSAIRELLIGSEAKLLVDSRV